MQIKQFMDHYIENVEKKANEWLDLEENHDLKIVSVRTEVFPMKDFFYDGNIANQWSEYITTVLFDY